MSDKLISHPHPTRKNFIDITGNRYGRLTVLSYGGTKNWSAQWQCVCSCGNTSTVHSSSLKSGDTKSCGCLAKERTTHGLCKTSIYHVWRSVVQRCTNKNNHAYKNYGGRGISVCSRWSDSVESFAEDMGPKPSDEYSIDRIDNDGDYTPENCRWATMAEQSKNKRLFKTNKTGVRGVFRIKSGNFRVTIGIKGKKIHIGTFSTINAAAEARKNAETKYWR